MKCFKGGRDGYTALFIVSSPGLSFATNENVNIVAFHVLENLCIYFCLKVSNFRYCAHTEKGT